MPTYTFENTKTGKVFDDFMSMDDKETYLEQNPHIKQIINKINIVAGVSGCSYRNYYILEKKRFATWKSPAKIPEWYKEGKIYGNEEEQYI